MPNMDDLALPLMLDPAEARTQEENGVEQTAEQVIETADDDFKDVICW